jgi:sugar lactone lactonase YvrE
MEYLRDEHVCGRALGIRFDRRTGDLYIADAYYGLCKVGPDGGLATPLAVEAEGVRFNFTNDLDLDADGNVYFTDSSVLYQRRSARHAPCPYPLLCFIQLHLIVLVCLPTVSYPLPHFLLQT